MSILDYLAEPPVVGESPELDAELVAPFPYFGGKRRAASLIWERLGDCVNVVEPFAGSLAVLLARPAEHTARVETANDLDGLVVNVWRAIAADPEGVATGCDWPVMELDLHARHKALIEARAELVERLEADPRYYDVELAAWWIWGASAWIGSGWCADSPSRRIPNVGGTTPNSAAARGVHAEGQRRPSKLPSVGASGVYGSSHGERGVHAVQYRDDGPGRQLPCLSGGGGPDGPQAVVGRGGDAASHREPSRRIPNLIGGADGPTPLVGKGVHAGTMRRQLPSIGGATSRGEAFANHGKGVHGAGTRTSLYDTFDRLCRRLRYVRIVCGDWRRVVTPAVTWRHGLTGVIVDPPYGDQKRTSRIYARDSLTVATDVRAWALEAGTRPDMRIALCGYAGEHDALEQHGWTVVEWKAHGGYGVQGQGDGRDNAARERIWFSPHCLDPNKTKPASPVQTSLW